MAKRNFIGSQSNSASNRGSRTPEIMRNNLADHWENTRATYSPGVVRDDGGKNATNGASEQKSEESYRPQLITLAVR